MKLDKLVSSKEYNAPSKLECGWSMFNHPSWGTEFKNSKKISKKGWNFKLTKEYRIWECEGFPGRTGLVYFEVLNSPGETLAQKLYNDDKKNNLAYIECLDGDSYRITIIPMQETINLIYNKLEQLINSDEIFEICETSLEDFYKRKIKIIQKYGAGD